MQIFVIISEEEEEEEEKYFHKLIKRKILIFRILFY